MTVYGPRCAVHPDRFGVRKSNPNRLLVVHTSEGAETGTSAESLCTFMTLPGDRVSDSGSRYGASYQYAIDWDRVLPAVPDDVVAFAAAGANNDGIHFCIPGKAAQTRAQWSDQASTAQLVQLASTMRDKAAEHDIPLVRLTVAQVRDGKTRGYCGHVDVSKAFGLSDHTDPGAQFPWDVLAGLLTPQEAPPMATLPAPIRILDTDTQGGRLAAGVKRWVGVLAPPADWARAVVVNLTIADPADQGWLSTDGGATTKVNFERGQEVSNEVRVPVRQNDAGGWGFEVMSNMGARLVVELVGWDSILAV